MPAILNAAGTPIYDRLAVFMPIPRHPSGRVWSSARMLLGFPFQFGYLALALLIAGESAGVPLPGETALVADLNSAWHVNSLTALNWSSSLTSDLTKSSLAANIVRSDLGLPPPS